MPPRIVREDDMNPDFVGNTNSNEYVPNIRMKVPEIKREPGIDEYHELYKKNEKANEDDYDSEATIPDPPLQEVDDEATDEEETEEEELVEPSETPNISYFQRGIKYVSSFLLSSPKAKRIESKEEERLKPHKSRIIINKENKRLRVEKPTGKKKVSILVDPNLGKKPKKKKLSKKQKIQKAMAAAHANNYGYKQVQEQKEQPKDNNVKPSKPREQRKSIFLPNKNELPKSTRRALRAPLTEQREDLNAARKRRREREFNERKKRISQENGRQDPGEQDVGYDSGMDLDDFGIEEDRYAPPRPSSRSNKDYRSSRSSKDRDRVREREPRNRDMRDDNDDRYEPRPSEYPRFDQNFRDFSSNERNNGLTFYPGYQSGMPIDRPICPRFPFVEPKKIRHPREDEFFKTCTICLKRQHEEKFTKSQRVGKKKSKRKCRACQAEQQTQSELLQQQLKQEYEQRVEEIHLNSEVIQDTQQLEQIPVLKQEEQSFSIPKLKVEEPYVPQLKVEDSFIPQLKVEETYQPSLVKIEEEPTSNIEFIDIVARKEELWYKAKLEVEAAFSSSINIGQNKPCSQCRHELDNRYFTKSQLSKKADQRTCRVCRLVNQRQCNF